MSAVRQFQPLMPFSVPAFAATLFALGLALGTTIAVGMLFFIQVQGFYQGVKSMKFFFFLAMRCQAPNRFNIDPLFFPS